ncbi:MAG: hypothetical protein OS130_10740 [Thermodesulfobacteriota bacterium]|jgi:hypothetical protein|nr:MAG: hypothetical protein OS130_10740 [Thermodesulfobacteriota bacterium]
MSKLKAIPLVISLLRASRALAVDTRTFTPLLLCAMVLLNSCIPLALPIPTGQKVIRGKQVNQEEMALLTPNVTTKKEVIDRLGEPFVRYDRLFVYQWTVRWGYLPWILVPISPVPVGSSGNTEGIKELTKDYGFLILFDEQDRVRRFEKMWLHGLNTPESLENFLREWVRNPDKASLPSWFGKRIPSSQSPPVIIEENLKE